MFSLNSRANGGGSEPKIGFSMSDLIWSSRDVGVKNVNELGRIHEWARCFEYLLQFFGGMLVRHGCRWMEGRARWCHPCEMRNVIMKAVCMNVYSSGRLMSDWGGAFDIESSLHMGWLQAGTRKDDRSDKE